MSRDRNEELRKIIRLKVNSFNKEDFHAICEEIQKSLCYHNSPFKFTSFDDLSKSDKIFPHDLAISVLWVLFQRGYSLKKQEEK